MNIVEIEQFGEIEAIKLGYGECKFCEYVEVGVPIN
jgi:hypothetical protein